MHFNRRLWLVSAAMGGLVMLAGCSPSAKPSAAPTTRNHGSAPIAVPTDESASLAQGFTTQLTSVAAINPATAGDTTTVTNMTCHRTGDTSSYACTGYVTRISPGGASTKSQVFITATASGSGGWFIHTYYANTSFLS
jgi:hypothetical protein